MDVVMVKRPKMAMFEKGQVWLLDDPVRIVRIDGPAVIDYASEGVQTNNALSVTATIPSKEIEGYVSPREAMRGRKLHGAIQRTDYSESDIAEPDNQWTEIWAERTGYEIGHVKGGVAAQIDERRPYIQVFCYETSGRLSMRERTSPIRGKPISGKLIPASLVPLGMFRGDSERVTPKDLQEQLESETSSSQPPELSSEEPFAPPVQQLSDLKYPQLKALAKSRGVDVSGISGKGTNKRIIEAIENAAKTPQGEVVQAGA